jgi:hypothetical protein
VLTCSQNLSLNLSSSSFQPTNSLDSGDQGGPSARRAGSQPHFHDLVKARVRVALLLLPARSCPFAHHCRYQRDTVRSPRPPIVQRRRIERIFEVRSALVCFPALKVKMEVTLKWSTTSLVPRLSPCYARAILCTRNFFVHPREEPKIPRT